MEWWMDLKDAFVFNFIEGNRWQLMLTGLGNTLRITLFAVLIGIAIGTLVATIRATYDKNGESMSRRNKTSYWLLGFVNFLCRIYLTVIRGTPVVVQLLICYFVIWSSSTNEVAVAVVAFGLNSGAYVAEIIRGGIMSIDEGQFEAGRSLGFNYGQTMIYIIIPQVVKVILPTIFSEFIVLLKETSVAGYIGLVDLTKAGDIIRGRTFSAFLPLLTVAAIYLIMVMGLTALDNKLERSLRKNER